MRGIILFLVLLFPAAPLHPQQIIINELYNSSSGDEWVELVVTVDGLDLRGSDLRDFTSGGTPQDPLTFLSVPLWSQVEAGTIILIAKPDAPIEEDTDPADHLLIVKADNKELFDGTLFLFAGTSDAIQVRDSSGNHLFGVSWGTANAGSLPVPRMHFEDASISNTSASFDGGSVPAVTDSAEWTRNNIAPSPAAGNSAHNTAMIDSLRGITAFVGANPGGPLTFRLEQNYPNPFNGISNFEFWILKFAEVNLVVHDLLGREVATIVNERLAPGRYTWQWNTAGLASGVYYYRLSTETGAHTRKLVLLR